MTPPGSEVTVDIGIPTVGVRPLLVEAIESVLAQTHERWRLVIHENGPADEAVRSMVEPYLGDPRIGHVVTGETLPPHANWTRVIQRGDAPYVAMLHDDDRWHPDYLARRIAFLEGHPECGFAFSGHIEIGAGGTEVKRRPLVLAGGVHEPREVLPLLYRNNVVPPPSLVVRRSAYEAVGPAFDPSLPFIDYEMWFRLALRFPVGFLAVRDCDMRVHEGSLTSRRPHLGEAYLRFTQHMEEQIAELRPEVRLDPHLRRRKRSYAQVKAALDAIEQEDRRRALGHLRAAIGSHRFAFLDPRIPVAVVAMALGPRGIRLLDALRAAVLRRELRFHLKKKPL